MKESKNDNWQTPPELFQAISNTFGPFQLDPCTSEDNPLKLNRWYTKEDDALKLAWDVKFFMNPPFSLLPQFTRKAYVESFKWKVTGVGLLPASRETIWWRRNVRDTNALVFDLPKRVKFVGASSCARFSSVIVIWPGGLREWWA